MNEHWCGCEGRLATDCRCMRGYTVIRRLRDHIDRDLILFTIGVLVGGLFTFGFDLVIG